eukprot:g14147.t1
MASLQEILVPFALAVFLLQLFEGFAIWLTIPRRKFLHKAVYVVSDLLIILFSLGLILLFVGLVFYGLSNLFDRRAFAKYYHSERVQAVIEYLKSVGITITPDEIVKRIEEPLTLRPWILG